MQHSIQALALPAAKARRGRLGARLLPLALLAVVAISGCSFMQQFGFVSPDTPTGLAVSNATDTTLDVSWDASIGAKGYTVSQSSSQTGTYTQIATISGTSTTVTGLTAATDYWFKVLATNTAGSSIASAPVKGTTTGGGGGGGGSTALTLATWSTGSLSSSTQSKDFTFDATAGDTYSVAFDDGSAGGTGTYTLDVVATVYHADKTTSYVTGIDTAVSAPTTFTASATETVTIRVTPKTSGGAGTYALMVIDSTSMSWLSSSFSIDSFGTWHVGSLATGSDYQTFVFVATAGHTYKIAADDYYDSGVDGYQADVMVSAYHQDGTTSYFDWVDNNYSSPTSMTATANEIVTLYVETFSGLDIDSGSYAIRAVY